MYTHSSGIAKPLVVCDSSQNHRSGQYLSTIAWCLVVHISLSFVRPSVRYTRTPFQFLWPFLYRHDIISLLSFTLFASLWPLSQWSCIAQYGLSLVAPYIFYPRIAPRMCMASLFVDSRRPLLYLDFLSLLSHSQRTFKYSIRFDE